jgi:hypothetical protein
MPRSFYYAIRAALALVMFLIPFRPVYGSYTLILLAGVGVAYAISQRKIERPPLIFSILASLYVVRLIFLIGTEDINHGLQVLETELPLLAVPLIFTFFPMDLALRNFAVRVYVIMCLSVMLYSFVQLGIYVWDGPYGFIQYTKYHLDPEWFWSLSRHFSFKMLNWEGPHYSFITVIILYGWHLSVNLRRESSYDKYVSVVYSVSLFVFLLYTGSRIGVAITLISLVCYAVFSIQLFWHNKVAFTAAAAIVVATASAFLVKYGERLDERRYHYAVRAIEAWKTDPWLGHGTGSGSAVMHEPDYEVKTDHIVNHPHNQFLSELIQFGLIGSIPLLVFLAYALNMALDCRDRGMLMILISVLIFMVTEAPLNSNKGLLPFVLIMAILAKFHSDHSSSRPVCGSNYITNLKTVK